MKHTCIFLLLLPVLHGCATTPAETVPEAAQTGQADQPPAAPAAVAPSAKAFPALTFSQEFGTYGELVRKLGEEAGGGLVLMHGLEPTPAPVVALKNAPFTQLVDRLAQPGLAAQPNPHYYFIHAQAPVYEPLLELQLDDALPAPYAQYRVEAAFGGGTALYNVLASLGKSLSITLIADNILSQSPCGELTLSEAPLPDVLEAVLKSALLPRAAFKVEATEEYVLFLSRDAPEAQELLLNGASLVPEQRAQLDRRVSVEVPRMNAASDNAVFHRGATRLKTVLPVLSQQLGVRIEADESLHEFPVTWTVMNEVRLKTALDLLIRQWPLPNFGYEMQPDRILIRER